MKQIHKDAWTEALRSDRYKQGRGFLKTMDLGYDEPEFRYCCLGVLCDVLQARFPEVLSELGLEIAEETGKRGCMRVKSAGESDGTITTLPYVLADWAGLLSPLGHLRGLHGSLSSLNDVGTSFREIADVIDKKVKVED